jgi:membrane-bound metal-dependent hydrolase YbcI (DUF457 family)
MPYATTHILLAILLIELYRDFFVKNNKKFPRYYILIAAIGSIIPDLDIALFYVVSFFGFSFNEIHRTFLHSIFIPLIFFLAGILTYALKIKNREFEKRHITLPTTFFILTFGIVLHLVLDATLSGSIMPFYPFSKMGIGLNLVNLFPVAWRDIILPTLDAALLLFWIFWMEFRLKINNYF